MQIDAWLGTTSLILGVTGIGSAAAVVRGFRNWGKSERERGKVEQKRADALVAYKKETADNLTQFKNYIEQKVDNATSALGGKIDAVKEDVADVKKDIRNGGLKEAIGAMQNACGSRMATVEAELRDHVRLSGHPGVTEKIAALQADVKTLKEK
jgi:hypothetical protein